jgi:hypothetical protein
MRASATVVGVVGVVVACATPPAPAAPALVVTQDGVVIHAGAAAWTVRATSMEPQDVVGVVGVGEILVERGGCRLVRSRTDGAISVTTSSPAVCAERRGDRLCFVTGARFVEADQIVAVRGCADRNELFLDRLGTGAGASIGPTSLVERCVQVPVRDPSWLRIREIVVDDVEQPERGLRLRYRDGFDACFLGQPRGRYRLVIDVEDPRPRRLELTGMVDELDER